ncbi:hypothetical protein AK812_SmicGene37215 [Symbiodinium microadriaticum]|uniref:Uncharacterized protein n=1 Tax=Symbiodinium microadriaticum TaxID=2951 RepID=A0A1Q9CGX4_SYMMI|nr:hypothetical protein AK812_SmicGene37215 [Symbiodinium microadriaticum]
MSEVAGDYREVYEVQVNEEEGPQAPKVDLRLARDDETQLWSHKRATPSDSTSSGGVQSEGVPRQLQMGRDTHFSYCAVKGLKETMYKMREDDVDTSVDELLSTAVRESLFLEDPGVWEAQERAPEHLRHASNREELLEALTEEKPLPWTYNRVVEQIGVNQYEDLTETPAPPLMNGIVLKILRRRPPASSSSGLQRPRVAAPETMETTSDVGLCWWNTIADEEWSETATAFWSEGTAAVAVAVDMPDIEVRNFIASEAFKEEAGRPKHGMSYLDFMIRGMNIEVGDAATGRLDDFLFGGASGDAEWQQILKKIKDKFRWGDWEEDTFTQCGVLITQTPEGFELSQKKYVEEHVVEVPLPSSRRKTPKAETTDREKTALRATLGAAEALAAVNGEVLSRKGAEKRSNLEMSGLKAGGAKELEMFYKMQYQWRQSVSDVSLPLLPAVRFQGPGSVEPQINAWQVDALLFDIKRRRMSASEFLDRRYFGESLDRGGGNPRPSDMWTSRLAQEDDNEPPDDPRKSRPARRHQEEPEPEIADSEAVKFKEMIAVGFHIEHVPVQQGIKICGGVNRVKEVIALGFQIEHASVQDVKIRGASFKERALKIGITSEVFQELAEDSAVDAWIRNVLKEGPGSAGVVFTPDTTPANSLVDLFVDQLESDILHYVGPERCVSRAQEMMSVKKDKTLNVDPEGRVRVASKPNELRCETSSDAKLRAAWGRRTLAMDLAGLCSYIEVEKWVQHLFSIQAREVPKGMSPISANQLIQADRALFVHASERLMGRLTAPTGAPKPLDSVIQDLLRSQFMQFVQPAPLETVVESREDQWAAANRLDPGRDTAWRRFVSFSCLLGTSVFPAEARSTGTLSFPLGFSLSQRIVSSLTCSGMLTLQLPDSHQRASGALKTPSGIRGHAENLS